MDFIDKAQFENLMNQARVKLTGASDVGIKAELYQVLKEFFYDSNSWTETIELPITPEIRCYKLVPRYGGKIIKLIGVVDSFKAPVGAFMPRFGELELAHAPRYSGSAAGAVSPPYPYGFSPLYVLATGSTGPFDPGWIYHVHVIKNLDWQTTRDMVPICPDWVLSVYEVTILDGLLGKMMTQQNKSYTDKETGLYHLRRFRTGIQQAKAAALHQNTMGAQNWRFPLQGGWRSRTQLGGVVTAWPPERI